MHTENEVRALCREYGFREKPDTDSNGASPYDAPENRLVRLEGCEGAYYLPSSGVKRDHGSLAQRRATEPAALPKFSEQFHAACQSIHDVLAGNYSANVGSCRIFLVGRHQSKGAVGGADRGDNIPQ